MDVLSKVVFEGLARLLQSQPGSDVTLDAGRLQAKGHVFALLTGHSLTLDLDADRARDLLARGIARPAEGPSVAHGRWVGIADAEDWPELASESRDFVAARAVGGQS